MPYDSSSDDEPMIDSPCSSSAEDDDSDDDAVFRTHAIRFQKRNVEEIDSSPPTSARKRRGHHLSVDDQMIQMERKNERRKQRWEARRSKTRRDSDSDSDEEPTNTNGCDAKNNKNNNKNNNQSYRGDDDVIEIIDDSSSAEVTPPKQQNTRRMFTRAASENAGPGLRNRQTTIDLLEDSSDEETAGVPLQSLAGLSKDTKAILERSKRAQQQLLFAQRYHAEDIEVQEPNIEIARPTILTASPSLSKTAKPPANLGKPIILKCRTQLTKNGKKQRAEDKTLAIREREPLQALLDKFRKAHGLPISARVTMTFDGEKLDTTKTPVSYEMEDGDLIDVTAEYNIIVMPLQTRTANTSNTTASLGPKLVLKLRRKVGKLLEEKSISHGQQETFESMVEKYKQVAKVASHETISFQFDGESLDLHKTPATYDMESGELIDVIVR